LIPQDFISEWKQHAPWTRNEQVEQDGHKISRAVFEQNMIEKLEDVAFIEDIGPLLIAGSDFDFREAAELLMSQLVSLIPGEPWHGRARG
jgi:hypothetical protein